MRSSLFIKKGEIIKLLNDQHIYFTYVDFLKRHPQYAIKWVYREMPNINHDFKVLGIYRNKGKDANDINNYIVVIRDIQTNQIYLTGEKGISFVTKIN